MFSLELQFSYFHQFLAFPWPFPQARQSNLGISLTKRSHSKDCFCFQQTIKQTKAGLFNTLVITLQREKSMKFFPRFTKGVVVVPHISPSPPTPSHITRPIVGESTASLLSDAQPLSYLIAVFTGFKLRRGPCTSG